MFRLESDGNQKPFRVFAFRGRPGP